jgi:hypothetical protein
MKRKLHKPQNILRHVPKTRREAFLLLIRVHRHFKKSGARGYQRFDNPKAAEKALDKVMCKLNSLYRRKRQDVFQPTLIIKRRRHVKPNVEHYFPKQIVPAKILIGEGFLRQPIEMGKAERTHTMEPGPFGTQVRVDDFLPRKKDMFLFGHRVKVFKNDRYFDVVDALCNFPIKSRLTNQSLQKVVEFNLPVTPVTRWA